MELCRIVSQWDSSTPAKSGFLQGETGGWNLTGTVVCDAQIRTATADLAERLGRAPNASELAEDLRMDRELLINRVIADTYNGNNHSDERRIHTNDPQSSSTAIRLHDDLEIMLDRIHNADALRPLLAKLPGLERSVLSLRMCNSLPQTRIAEEVGITLVEVTELLGTALKRLRDQLP